MSIYCIGDLHGRYDLFTELLTQIQFNPAFDKLYFLGDVIDWNKGGVKILDYIHKHQDACVLIKGNHEEFFLSQTKVYDLILVNQRLKNAFLKAVTVYSSNLFDQIEGSYLYCFRSGNRDSFYSSRKINKWVTSGAPHIRRKLLDGMVDLAEAVNYDKTLYENIRWILTSLKGQFRTKAFVLELLEIDYMHYLRIKDTIKSAPNTVSLTYCGQQLHLTHSRHSLSMQYYRGYQFPHADTEDTIYIFGHDPVPSLHRTLKGYYAFFDFDYHQFFTWSDLRNNYYYHLDLSSNPIGALRLDDMSMHYVGKHSMRTNAKEWRVPAYVPSKYKLTHVPLSFARINDSSFYNASILSLNNGCSEFLIGIHSYSKSILYTHICLMDYHIHFTIDGWFSGQSFDDIIAKVRTDFRDQINRNDVRELLAELRKTHY